MIAPSFFIETLQQHDIDFFAGVPDSLLKSVCAYLQDEVPAEQNIITANEGAAVGLGAGYHLATGKVPVIYMQNSGLGNIVNPLLSLTDKEVYNIPLLLLIGWRGEPGIKDEPQHVKQGKVTLSLLEALGIHYEVLTTDAVALPEQLSKVLAYIQRTNEPVALVVRKDTFEPYTRRNSDVQTVYPLGREQAIGLVISALQEQDAVVSTTGMISRELFELREAGGKGHARDFLTVGSMGHASQIALGIALRQPDRRVYCFDGDGAVLMHMGSLPVIGSLAPRNLVHVVFNNGAHDSVGGQPTVGFATDFPAIAAAGGYQRTYSVATEEALYKVLQTIDKQSGPILIEIKVRKGARKDLGRPTTTPQQNKEAFIRFLRDDS